jgi:hypothetical protein
MLSKESSDLKQASRLKQIIGVQPTQDIAAGSAEAID